MTKDKNGNTVYSYTTIEQVVDENDDSSVNDTNDQKSIELTHSYECGLFL